MHPAGFVNSQDGVVGNGLRLNEIGRLGEAFRKQALANEPVLARREHMVAQVQIVARMINQLERKHAA